jgi:hypothetical protein
VFKPSPEPAIVIAIVVRISLTPASVILCFQGSFTVGFFRRSSDGCRLLDLERRDSYSRDTFSS